MTDKHTYRQTTNKMNVLIGRQDYRQLMIILGYEIKENVLNRKAPFSLFSPLIQLQDSNPGSQGYESDIVPLCYNHSLITNRWFTVNTYLSWVHSPQWDISPSKSLVVTRNCYLILYSKISLF